MSIAMIIRSLFEVLLIGFTLWAVLHEERIADFEHRVLRALLPGRKSANAARRDNIIKLYTPAVDTAPASRRIPRI